MRRLNKKRVAIVVLGALILVGIVSGALYYMYTWFKGPSVAFDLSDTASSAPIFLQRAAPAGWKEYQSAQYGFSLFYPQELTAENYDEGGGAATLTFQSIDPVEGFQVFVTPYTENTISEQRFREDEPSGVREQVSYGTISGADGVAFYSKDQRLGETYEVWILHGGYLFEITTLKPLDSWLNTIMQSWEFAD